MYITIAKLINNSAQLIGGAIYADDAYSNSKCVIQIGSSIFQCSATMKQKGLVVQYMLNLYSHVISIIEIVLNLLKN